MGILGRLLLRAVLAAAIVILFYFEICTFRSNRAIMISFVTVLLLLSVGMLLDKYLMPVVDVVL